MSNQNDIFPCLRGVMGDWVYYSTLMTAGQVSRYVSTAKSIRESESLDDYLQRDLTKNVNKICHYLTKCESRMFNSMIIGVFDGTPNWLSFDLTKSDKLEGYSEDSLNYLSDSIGLLLFEGNEQMFAIDGQHRAEAIKCAFGKDQGRIDDQYSVIFVAHKDDEGGRKRSRKLFADINKKAVKVSTGDLVIIDEEEPSSIVARRIYRDSPYFAGGELIALTKTANLDQGDNKHFTTLIIIDQVIKILKPLHSTPRKKVWEDAALSELTRITSDFFDFVVEKIDEYKEFFTQNNHTLVTQRDQEPNLLFRPIGLTLLAKVYRFFKTKDEIDYLASHINNIDFSLPGIHFDRVAWNNGRMDTKHQKVVYMLFLYLLDSLPEEEFDGENGLVSLFQFATKGSRELPQKIV